MTLVAHVLLIAVVVLSVPLVVAVGVFALQIAAQACATGRSSVGDGAGAAARGGVAILVPAHNEEDGIAQHPGCVPVSLISGGSCVGRRAPVPKGEGPDGCA